ncbi:MFS transporter [Ellagibacter isourolithinifaciens]|uniref:MFS transporter n=1 Tax=Ellagibacter isourolithinifaciens TaxID=2137581 RepID=UPI002E77C718|nr:MFS transporter [Ellagibacter isourolithinifaciens]MEE0246274.1 MFS transporter [Ellagibacter isourolithinifaciens]
MSEEARKSEINQTGRAWVVAIVAIIASILISVNNNKLPATASLVLPALGIDTGALSTLMSLNGYVGFVLAFVAATIIMKFGSKKSTLMVLACALVGAVISAFAQSYELLVVGRLIEGVGYACIGTVVPVLVSEWFPPSKRGVPMGIFSVWVPLGSMFIMGTSGFFFNTADPSSYHNVFWFVVVLMAIITVIWVVAVRNPQHSYLEDETDPNAPKPKVSEGFKSLSCWIAMIAFAAFSLGTACVMNFETLYMVQTMGMDQAAANGMLNIANIAVVIGGVGIGFVLNAVKSNSGRLAILAVSSAVLGVCFALAYTVGGAMLTPWLIVFGLSNGIVPAIFFTMVAEIAPRPELASVSSTLMSCGQCVGGILFAAVGAVVAAAGWGACTGLLAAVGVVLFLGSLALLFVLKARDKKQA